MIIVNDKSSDKSLEVAQELSRKYNSVTVIDNPENIGCHPSQLVGWNSSDADILYMLPSDRQIPPNSIPELIMNLRIMISYGPIEFQETIRISEE